MGKERFRLDNIGYCLSCGISEHKTLLDKDHYLPRALVNRPSEVIKPEVNPIRQVIYRRANIFRLCIACHHQIDNGKMDALLHPHDPTKDDIASLCSFLMQNYPVTTLDNYRQIQIKMLWKTNFNFIKKAFSLNGEFPRHVKRSYLRGAVYLMRFNVRLNKLDEEDDLGLDLRLLEQ